MTNAHADEPTPAQALRIDEIPDHLLEELASAEMKPNVEDDLPRMGRHPPTD